MSTLAMDIAKMVDMLPESDQEFALVFVKKLVLAWDPDFTRVTEDEAARLDAARAGDFIPAEEIDWDSLGADA